MEEHYKIIDETLVKGDQIYVLKLTGSSFGKIAISTSTLKCQVYSYNDEGLNKTFEFSELENPPCDIRFCPKNDSLIYTASADGTIKLWDSRCSDKYVTLFEEDPDTREFIKPLSSFDISCDGRFLCGGSELVQSDAYMLFWDIRSKSLLGGYWNSHNDDIVQVHFNKQKPNILVTGGMDGLVNVFDIYEKSETNSLLYSLSIDCAVDKINWISEDTISCLTQNIDLQFWNVDTADRLEMYTRQDIANSCEENDVNNCYVVDVYNTVNNNRTILTGSYDNTGTLNLVNIADKKLTHKSVLKNNNQIIRCSYYDEKKNIIISGGEMGILQEWKHSDNCENVAKEKGDKKNISISSAMEKLKVHKSKPY